MWGRRKAWKESETKHHKHESLPQETALLLTHRSTDRTGRVSLSLSLSLSEATEAASVVAWVVAKIDRHCYPCVCLPLSPFLRKRIRLKIVREIKEGDEEKSCRKKLIVSRESGDCNDTPLNVVIKHFVKEANLISTSDKNLVVASSPSLVSSPSSFIFFDKSSSFLLLLCEVTHSHLACSHNNLKVDDYVPDFVLSPDRHHESKCFCNTC